MKIIAAIIFLFIIYSNSFFSSASTLKLVHILFRHGARTVDIRTRYPKDPYFNETYHPYGYGQLTKKGKHQMYVLGKHLRKKYNNFLGAHYLSQIVEAVSSDIERCKASLQLVLAGLFPPTKSEMFDSFLPWQPIPISVVPADKDIFFVPSLTCPNFEKLLAKYLTSVEFKKILQPDLKTFEYILEHTGLEMENYYYECLKLQSLLEGEEEWGLTLPDWTKPVYPEILNNLTYKSYQLITATPELKQMLSGSFLQKIIIDSKAKINGNHKKIILYAGHDLTIVTLMIVLDVYKPHLVKYGSQFVFELHEISGTYGFKIYYNNGVDPHSEKDLLRLPNCKEFCPIEEFERLTKLLMPRPGFCHGNISNGVNSLLDSKCGRFVILVSLFALVIKL